MSAKPGIAKINWFSPFPPVRSGIADFSAQVAHALADRCELALWTIDAEMDPALERAFQVRRYHPLELDGSEFEPGSVNVYNIGNHPVFHGPIWEVSRRFPGVAILHDVRLQQLFLNYFSLEGISVRYKAEMYRLYGDRGLACAVESLMDPRQVDRICGWFTLVELVTENALAAVCHTGASLAEARDGRAPAAPMTLLPLPCAAPGHLGLAQAPAGPPWQLTLFGHLGPNRGVLETLQALGQLEPELRSQFRCALYGELWDLELVRAEIERCGLGDRVSLHGFVTDPELDAALARTHLAINLRNPTMGEASLSQLRVWSHAVPAIVADTGWYSEIPDGLAEKISPENLVAELRDRLAGFPSQWERYARMGRAGREHVARVHSPEAYADGILRIAGEALAQSAARSGIATRAPGLAPGKSGEATRAQPAEGQAPA